MYYKVFFIKGEDGYIVAECPAIPGCISQGRTLKEAKKNIKEAIELCLECYKEDKKRLPRDRTQVAKIAVGI